MSCGKTFVILAKYTHATKSNTNHFQLALLEVMSMWLDNSKIRHFYLMLVSCLSLSP